VRIDQEFAGKQGLGRTENIRFQNDVKNCRAERLCPHILRLLAASKDPAAVRVTAALSGWNHRYDLASAAPTVFETFMALWTRHVLAEHLPERLLDLTSQQSGLAASLLEGAVPDYFATGTAAHAITIAGQADAALRARLGEDPAGWQWERVHIAHWRHPMSLPVLAEAFDIGPAPVDGGSHTVRNTGGELPPHGASSGAEYRLVVDFTDPSAFLAVQNIGNSGMPGSPHYRDQFRAWIDGTYHVVHLTRDGVEADCASTTQLVPTQQ
jgi:penicillin G amidase